MIKKILKYFGYIHKSNLMATYIVNESQFKLERLRMQKEFCSQDLEQSFLSNNLSSAPANEPFSEILLNRAKREFVEGILPYIDHKIYESSPGMLRLDLELNIAKKQ
jgi:hypothetical protein